jgi:hypothetical protein
MGLAPLAVFININPLGMLVRFPAAVETQGMLYRGTPDGAIQVSRDGGRTWTLHSRLGPQMAVIGMSKDLGGRVIIHLEHQGWPVRLGLEKKGKFWVTL